MGCCLFGCISAIWPRIALLILWIFTLAPVTYPSRLYPILGFLLFPTTTLAWHLLVFFRHGNPIENSPLAMLTLALAALHDLAQLGVFKKRRKSHSE